MDQLNTTCYRAYLPDKESVKGREQETIYTHTAKVFENMPFLIGVVQHWQNLWSEPFHGITIDGTLIPSLYPVQDDGLDTESIIKTTSHFLNLLDSEQRIRAVHNLDSPKRRAWANPELYIWQHGLRLEEVGMTIRNAVDDIIKSTTSPEGYQKIKSAMKVNEFLGQMVNAPQVLNTNSYNFLFFLDPSTSERFGWLLYGHHICLSAFVCKNQVIMTPTFCGAEPHIIDEGPHKGLSILHREQDLGLAFMQKLPKEMRSKAQLFKTMETPEIPDERFHPADQRHLCGAFQDNRIVPYEGICVAEIDPALIDILLQAVEQFVLYLPAQARQNRLAQVKRHLNETYFCWIGGYGDNDPFYYRIQSPVIICEFDHHSGVFLLNKAPQRFHIHTVVRSPNGGDYGYALPKARWHGKNCNAS